MIHNLVFVILHSIQNGFPPKFTFNTAVISVITASTKEFCISLRTLQDELKLTPTQQPLYCNGHHRPTPSCNISDRVYMSTKNIKTIRSFKKLDHVCIGPYKITKTIGSRAYKLELPLNRKIHPVFHDNLLSRTDQEQLPDIPGCLPRITTHVTSEDEGHFEVEELMNNSFRYSAPWYLVRCKGYPDPFEDTW